MSVEEPARVERDESALPQPVDPREQLRDLIAAKVYECASSSFNSSDWIYESDARRYADAVMDLFVDVIGESPWLKPGYAVARIKEHTG